MEVHIHKEIDSLNKIMPKWETLKEEFHDITVFQEIGWFTSWWSYKSKRKDITPYIVEIKDKSKTIGIIPLYCSQVSFARVPFRILKPIGFRLSDYLVPILSKSYDPKKVIKKAWKKVYEDKKNWDCIDWGSVPEYSVFDTVLNENLMHDFSLVEREKTTVCPFLLLDGDANEVKLKLSRSLVKEIQKKERKIRKQGELCYKVVKDEKDIGPIVNKLFELHCDRWEETDTPSKFIYKDERDYTMLAAKNLFKKGLLRLSYLTYNNNIVAVDFAMNDGKKIYLYLTAFCMEHSKYSVGNILLYHLILSSCEEGYEIVDFARGNEGYKQRWGVENKFNVRYAFYNQSIRSLLYKSINQAYKYKQFQLMMEKLSDNFNNPKGIGKRLLDRLKLQQVENKSWFLNFYFLSEICSI